MSQGFDVDGNDEGELNPRQALAVRDQTHAGSEELEARQTLDQWMAMSREEMLALDEDALLHALTRMNDRVMDLGAIIVRHMPIVVAAQQEVKILALVKSSVQSVLRTLRDISH